MTARTLPIKGSVSPANLRAFDIRHDLLAVADLVEDCFAETLDADGRLYIEQMRRTARSDALTKMAAGGRAGSLPMGGFVWVEDSRVVGNLSLIEQSGEGQRIQLIANVAVAPEYRRRGIARMLTQAALQRARQQGTQEIWLQVDETNPPAILLYESMGFVEAARRTSWRVRPRQVSPDPAQSDLVIALRRDAHWRQQQPWLRRLYPASVRWNLPFHEGLLDPGWRGAFQRMFDERGIQQWSALRGRQLLGVLSWQSSSLSADRLWLALPPKPDQAAVRALVQLAGSQLAPDRELALNFPARLAEEALSASGLKASRTLIWMRLAK